MLFGGYADLVGEAVVVTVFAVSGAFVNLAVAGGMRGITLQARSGGVAAGSGCIELVGIPIFLGPALHIGVPCVVAGIAGSKGGSSQQGGSNHQAGGRRVLHGEESSGVAERYSVLPIDTVKRRHRYRQEKLIRYDLYQKRYICRPAVVL